MFLLPQPPGPEGLNIRAFLKKPNEEATMRWWEKLWFRLSRKQVYVVNGDFIVEGPGATVSDCYIIGRAGAAITIMPPFQVVKVWDGKLWYPL